LNIFVNLPKWEIFIGTQCCYCETILTSENLTRDHVIPRFSDLFFNVDSGLNNNIIACCSKCNNKKANSSLLAFLGLLPETVCLNKKPGWIKTKKCIPLSTQTGLLVKAKQTKKSVKYAFFRGVQQVYSCTGYQNASLFAKAYSLGKKHANS